MGKKGIGRSTSLKGGGKLGASKGELADRDSFSREIHLAKGGREREKKKKREKRVLRARKKTGPTQTDQREDESPRYSGAIPYPRMSVKEEKLTHKGWTRAGGFVQGRLHQSSVGHPWVKKRASRIEGKEGPGKPPGMNFVTSQERGEGGSGEKGVRGQSRWGTSVTSGSICLQLQQTCMVNPAKERWGRGGKKKKTTTGPANSERPSGGGTRPQKGPPLI